MSLLVDRLLAVHDALTAAKLPHAFGGAIALAYCTQEPRGTRDLDVNIFTDFTNAREALAALPDGVTVEEKDVEQVLRDGQARLWWDETPVDVFLNNHPYHRKVAKGVRWVPLADRDVPVLDCASLIVFKALFNRTKDWADIEAIVESGADGPADALSELTEMLGKDDTIVSRLASACDPSSAGRGAANPLG